MYVVDNIASLKGQDTFSQLLPARLWSRLEKKLSRPGSLAIAATRAGEPLGIVLACCKAGSCETAEIHALYVAAQHRRTGMASSMLRRLERELASSGYRRCDFFYVAEAPSAEAFEALFARVQWSKPSCHAYLCETDYEHLMQAPWMGLKLDPEYEIFFWTDIHEEERQYIDRQKLQDWFPLPLDPFAGETSDCFAPGSLGLRYRGKLVGWSIAKYSRRGVVSCSSLFVDPALQGSARAIALLGESIRRTQGYKYTFDVSFERTTMRKFVDRRMRPYLTAIRTAQRCSRIFPPVLIQQPETGN